MMEGETAIRIEPTITASTIVAIAVAYIIITGAEVALAHWIGRREEFSFHGRYTIFLFGGNLLLMLLALWRGIFDSGSAIWYFGIWTYLLCLTFYDLKYRELPDWWHLLPIFLYAVAWLFGYQPIPIRESIFAVLILAAVFGLIYVVRKDAIGLGDIKLILVCALYLGRGCAGMLVRGMVGAFVCSMALLLFKKVTVKSELPFVPFLLLGALFL